ncbi:hypothetical protein [Spiroplasma endosymbiont of Tipula paludosa]|uniref:hypothetical protein n=1 Tax=Spiroplasma endosymbiont of Tipula paludosa TaxID=3066295 RepID=UPI0035C8AD6D
MSKISIKDIIMFLKVFGISSLFFIAGIVICLIGHTHLNIDWPAYVIISAMLISAGIIVLIIETIRSIYIKSKNIDKDLDVLKDYLDNHGYSSWIEQQNKNIMKGKKHEKNL